MMGAALATLFCGTLARADAPADSAPEPAAAAQQKVSPEEYRRHLGALIPVVEACAKARDTRSCNPELVGSDDLVAAGSSPTAARKLIRYGWLRVLIAQAQKTDEPAPQPAIKGAAVQENAQPATTSELLKDARTRLQQEISGVDAAPIAPPARAAERDTLRKVLAGHEFRHLQETPARDTFLEALGNWLNRLFESAAKFIPRAAWVGSVLVWGFVLAVCVALVWGLIQFERRWRVRLTPEWAGPGVGAASARDWQLWLDDARAAAAAGQWREAVHFVYWASISRLESKRLWPADRARTPREYLALVAPADPRRPGLTSLTRSFERIWYGGRAAGEADYRKAEQLAEALIAGQSGINSLLFRSSNSDIDSHPSAIQNADPSTALRSGKDGAPNPEYSGAESGSHSGGKP